MFLRNTRWLRYSALVTLVLVVNLAGVWPLLSQSTAEGLDIFQRYGKIMTAGQALQMTFQAEFCGDAPTTDDQPVGWNAHDGQHSAKLILPGEVARLPAPAVQLIRRASEQDIPGRIAGLPATPPPRA